MSGKEIVSAERLHLVRVHEPLRRKDRCHATVYSRQVPNTLTPSWGPFATRLMAARPGPI